MSELSVELVDGTNFEAIPTPARRQARCQTCDYWERIDGSRVLPDDAADGAARAALKLRRLLAGEGVTGSYAMLAVRTDTVERTVVGYAQFGPISAYPRALSIRERYPQLPDSPAPWVVTCLQVLDDEDDREGTGIALLRAVCDELDRRGITSVEAYPERVADAWLPPSGPAAVYDRAAFERVAGDEHYPVYRRELTGEPDADAWSGLLRAARPDEAEDWPMPSSPSDDDFFRLPPERPNRPNPFGDD